MADSACWGDAGSRGSESSEVRDPASDDSDDEDSSNALSMLMVFLTSSSVHAADLAGPGCSTGGPGRLLSGVGAKIRITGAASAGKDFCSPLDKSSIQVDEAREFGGTIGVGALKGDGTGSGRADELDRTIFDTWLEYLCDQTWNTIVKRAIAFLNDTGY